MEQDHERQKQQTARHLQELQKRRELEQRRADFYAKRQREIEEAREANKLAKEDKRDTQQKLRQQMMFAKRELGGRIE